MRRIFIIIALTAFSIFVVYNSASEETAAYQVSLAQQEMTARPIQTEDTYLEELLLAAENGADFAEPFRPKDKIK